MAVYQRQLGWLTHCYREQAPSHILDKVALLAFGHGL
jgi:hypothetical protein